MSTYFAVLYYVIFDIFKKIYLYGCLVPMDSGRECRRPWSWIRLLQATVPMLVTKPKSSARKSSAHLLSTVEPTFQPHA